MAIKLSKIKILILVLVIIFIFISLLIFYSQRVNQQESETNNLLVQYEQAVYTFSLHADYTSYEETSDPNDIMIEPSNVTESIVKRWRDLTEAYPEAGHPKEAIEQEDWLTAGDVYLETNSNRSKIVSDIGDTFPEETPQPVARSFNDYIQLGEVYHEELKERMIEDGLVFKD